LANNKIIIELKQYKVDDTLINVLYFIIGAFNRRVLRGFRGGDLKKIINAPIPGFYVFLP
jgi:hypothetical protein